MLAQDIQSDARFGDLESTGYVVVPAFLTDQEATLFERDFLDAAGPVDGSYAVRQVSAPARAAIHDKLQAVARAVAQTTRIRVDLVSAGVFGSIYFTTEGEIGTGWHQDAVSYYAYQNHHDYLNFYIPVVKPDRGKSNLCVVPLDRLAARSPALARRLHGRGATRFEVVGGQTIAHDSSTGGRHGVVPYPLDDLAETPQLERGDLLLVRGDVVHRTEDRDTRRIAVSIRMMNSQAVVQRGELVRGGLLKASVMARGRRDFQHLLDCFTAAGKPALTIGEIVAMQDSGAVSPRPSSSVGFLARLMWHRLRDRVAR